MHISDFKHIRAVVFYTVIMNFFHFHQKFSNNLWKKLSLSPSPPTITTLPSKNKNFWPSQTDLFSKIFAPLPPALFILEEKVHTTYMETLEQVPAIYIGALEQNWWMFNKQRWASTDLLLYKPFLTISLVNFVCGFLLLILLTYYCFSTYLVLQ